MDRIGLSGALLEPAARGALFEPRAAPSKPQRPAVVGASELVRPELAALGGGPTARDLDPTEGA